jgi:O-antigen ligase
LGIWTVETRLKVWKLGFDEMVRHPLVGIGYGNKVFQPVLMNTPMRETPMHLHNAPLMVGVGTGFPGLLLFLWIFIRLGWTLIPQKIPRQWKNPESLRLCFGIVLLGFFFRNLFDYMFAGSLAYLFWILMGCGIGITCNENRLNGCTVNKV